MFLSRRRDGDSNGGLIIAPNITRRCCSYRDYDSNGRLDGEIGGVDGAATPSLAESIRKFGFVSRRIALFGG